jgi:O-antigen ligase
MRIHLDQRLLAVTFLVSSLTLSIVIMSSGYRNSYLLIMIASVLGVALLIRPDLPMSILFPLVWLFWAYNLPLVGGRLERIIGLMSIAGILILFAGKRRRVPSIPPLVLIGPGLLFVAYLFSGLINSSSGTLANVISVGTRILFLYLAFLLLSAPGNLRTSAFLMILTGFIGGFIILYWNVLWGIGFTRTYTGALSAYSNLGQFWYSLLLGGNSLTIPAVLLIGFSSVTERRQYRYLALTGAGFLFAMAFLSQFRREILISAALVLVYLIVTNLNNLRKPAIWVLLLMSVFYILVLNPSPLFQERIAETKMISAGTDPRLISFKAGLQAFLDSPLFGTGPSSFENSTLRTMGPGYPSFYYHAYNVFIYFAVEAGILGLAGLLITLCGVFYQMRRSRADPGSPQDWILISAPMVMIVILVSFLFGNAIELSLPWYLMGMILAAASLSPLITPSSSTIKHSTEEEPLASQKLLTKIPIE